MAFEKLQYLASIRLARGNKIQKHGDLNKQKSDNELCLGDENKK